jgi:hypothetical protein
MMKQGIKEVNPLDKFRPEWLNKRRLASDPDLRALQLRWAKDDLWIRRIEVGLTVAAVLAALTSVAFPLLAHPDNPYWYGLPPGAGLVAGASAFFLRKLRLDNAPSEEGKP